MGTPTFASALSFQGAWATTKWVISGSTAHSGTVGHSDQATLSVTIYSIAKQCFEFSWQVSSHTDDYLYFYVDGVEKYKVSGVKTWEAKKSTLAEKSITNLRWVYKKNAQTVSGNDRGEIKGLTLSSGVCSTGTTTTKCLETCLFSKDGGCDDDGGLCEYGTDCTDCGVRTLTSSAMGGTGTTKAMNTWTIITIVCGCLCICLWLYRLMWKLRCHEKCYESMYGYVFPAPPDMEEDQDILSDDVEKTEEKVELVAAAEPKSEPKSEPTRKVTKSIPKEPQPISNMSMSKNYTVSM